jgi:hypothetical protein
MRLIRSSVVHLLHSPHIGKPCQWLPAGRPCMSATAVPRSAVVPLQPGAGMQYVICRFDKYNTLFKATIQSMVEECVHWSNVNKLVCSNIIYNNEKLLFIML